MNLQLNASLRERLTSPLLWHLAGAGALLILTIFLGVRFGIDWTATNNNHQSLLLSKQMEIKALDLQVTPLRGLDQRVENARGKMDAFYKKRIPTTYSQIAERVGDLQVKSGVRLTRVQYSQSAPGTDLTEIQLDANISGNYPEIMHFTNALERDQYFFVVRAMSLTGQQGGAVNLRMKVSTWMRPADAQATGLPSTEELKAKEGE
jgi:Tfp pilus assembly protein PilO